MAEKKKFKFNIIDIIVLVVLIAAICFAGYKLFFDRLDDSATPTKERELSYTIEFYCEESPAFSAELVQVGDNLVDEYLDVPLGKITKVELAPSVSYATDAEGNWVVSSKEGYNSLKITTELKFKGVPYAHGIQVDTFKYGVGHSMTFRAGKAKLYGRISGIEEN